MIIIQGKQGLIGNADATVELSLHIEEMFYREELKLAVAVI